MALTWQVTQQDTLRIQDRASGGPVIWIFGGLLLLAGGRFAWWLLLALGEMGQALFRGDLSYIFSHLVGLILVLVMTAAFLLPGCGCSSPVVWSRCMPPRDMSPKWRDYVVWRKTKRHDLADMAAVRGTHSVSQTNSKSRTVTVKTYRLDVFRKAGE